MITVTDPLGVTNVYYTGEDGCIVIDVPVNGKYTIEEEIPEGWHVTATIIDGEYVAPTNVVTITVGKNHGDLYTVTFGNFEEFCVDGYKYDDLNGDGNWDIGELGIEGWKVTLYRSTDGGITWTEYAVDYTDANGYYMICVDVGGDFKIEEEMQTGWVPTSPTYFTFVGTSGTDQGPFSFFNFQCFYVEGYKYEDMSGDGDWDAGDTGIPGWHITLYKKDTFGAWQVFDEMDTDGSGHYSFYVCEAGDFKVEEEVQDGWIATAPTYYTFTAVSGQSQTFDFFNFQLGRICGEKWYDLDRDGVKDSSEVTIEGFKIELWKDGSLIATVYTDGDGQYCFENLGPGDYEVREIMPTDPDDYQVWAPTYPDDGIWYIGIMTSGFEKLDADFGNIVEFTGGLTWGYWKTHTGHMSPPRDLAYELLPDNPMEVDLPTPNGDYLIDSDDEAYWMFWGAGTGESPNCSDDPDGGKCRTLFRAQLLALHMNLLKFDGMGDTTFVYPGDDYNGQTVQDIYDAAIDLLTDGGIHDFTDFQNTLDRINNNEHYSLGSHVLIITTPPTPVY